MATLNPPVERSTTQASGDTQYQMGQLALLGRNGVVVYTASGAITLQSGTHVLTKAGVAAMTLAAPTENGQRLFITSTTDNAHTITATTLLNNGGSGVPYTTITFAAHAGAGVELVSYNGLWQVVSTTNATLS